MMLAEGSRQSPVVSVCIANYNGMEVIDDCLRSVLAQVGDVPVEVLVHDDASSDGSADHIRSRYPDVKLIESSENVGFCVANNRMATAARGRYLLLLNNDAALFPDALQTLLFEANRLGPSILGLPQFDAASGKLVDIGSLLDPFLNPIPNLNPLRGEVGMVIGACLWIPKELWEELGGFPEWFGSIAEDMYLCCYARLKGYAVRVSPVSGYRHWQGKSFGGGKVTVQNRLNTTSKRRALSERNKSFTMVLTYPAPLFQFMFPLHLILLLLEGLALSLLKWDIRLLQNIYLECFRALWQRRQRLAESRREIQSVRRIRLGEWLSVFSYFPRKLALMLRHGLPEIR